MPLTSSLSGCEKRKLKRASRGYENKNGELGRLQRMLKQVLLYLLMLRLGANQRVFLDTFFGNYSSFLCQKRGKGFCDELPLTSYQLLV